MLDKCANPGCVKTFRKLQEGKLFLVENEARAALPSSHAFPGRSCRHTEYYWLCDQCASVLTLSFDQTRGVLAVPLEQAMRKKPAATVRLGETAGTSLVRCDATLGARGGTHEA